MTVSFVLVTDHISADVNVVFSLVDCFLIFVGKVFIFGNPYRLIEYVLYAQFELKTF